jgi:hypothetical protein
LSRRSTRTSNQTIELFEKTLGDYQAASVPDSQRRLQAEEPAQRKLTRANSICASVDFAK